MSLLIHPSLDATRPVALQSVRRRAPSVVRPSQGLINRLAACLDAALTAGLALAVTPLSHADGGPTLAEAAVLGAVGAATLATVLGASGSYRPERRRFVGPALIDIFTGVTIAASMNGLLITAFASEGVRARLWLSLWTAGTLLALPLARIVTAKTSEAFGARWRRRRTAVVGKSAAALALYETLRKDDRTIALGRYTDQGNDGHDLAALRRLAEEEGVDLIVLTGPWSGPHSLFTLTSALQWISADIAVLVDDPDTLKGSRMMTDVAGRPALILHRHPLKGAEALLKLLLDYTVATAILLLAAPLMLATALALKLSGGGPVLFRQRRLGFNGRPFTIYKFRSMRVDPTDDGSRGAVAGDPRLTRLGAFLRRTSIDELPQLFNVLKGDMSVVGPRPHVANMQVGSGAYAEVVRAYAARHQIKPGVTGWAQINGMRGGIHSVERARRGVELDLHYIRNWSLWLDLRIILATAFRGLMGPSVF